MSLRLRSGTILLIIQPSNDPTIIFPQPLTLHPSPFTRNPHQPKPIIRQLKQGIRQLVDQNLAETPEFGKNI